MLKPPEPLIVAGLFPETHDALLVLLRNLSPQEWALPTACAGWTVKDMALHLLGGALGNLSRRRDHHAVTASVAGWDGLVAYINEWNERWVQASRRLSTRLLVDLLELSGAQLNAYFLSLDPYATGGAVSWAGPQPAPVWLDLAREYTEIWHHQQHIRDAVGRPGLADPRHMAPVLAAFVRAMPHTYRSTIAEEGSTVTLSISGESGGRWTLRRESGAWAFYDGAPDQPSTEVVLDQDTAWRLFTRGIRPDTTAQRISIGGNLPLGRVMLDMVSIIA